MIKILKTVLKELHKIREQHYEEEKGLSIAEKITKRSREEERIIKKHGLRFKQRLSCPS